MVVFLLVLSVFIGVFLGVYFGSNENLAKRLLVLSAGFLITICVVEVFPQVYHSEDKNIGLWIVFGVILQMFLESLTKGFEHGHFHYERCHILPFGLVVGMFIHAFIEGIPLSSEGGEISPYLLGILFHNLPISFVLGVFLLREKKKVLIGWVTILLFAMASPLGLFFGSYLPLEWNAYFLALSGGIFLHIASVIIFEHSKGHRMNWEKMFLVVLGMLMALLGHMFHSH